MNENLQERVNATLAAKPEVTVTSPQEEQSLAENETAIKITLPNNCYMEGKVIDYGDGNIWLMGDMTRVPDELQKNGIGERLSRAFFEEGKRLGATNVYVEVWSRGGLKLTARLHGVENLTFHNLITREVLKDMTYERALAMGEDVRMGISARLG